MLKPMNIMKLRMNNREMMKQCFLDAEDILKGMDLTKTDYSEYDIHKLAISLFEKNGFRNTVRVI